MFLCVSCVALHIYLWCGALCASMADPDTELKALCEKMEEQAIVFDKQYFGIDPRVRFEQTAQQEKVRFRELLGHAKNLREDKRVVFDTFLNKYKNDNELVQLILPTTLGPVVQTVFARLEAICTTLRAAPAPVTTAAEQVRNPKMGGSRGLRVDFPEKYTPKKWGELKPSLTAMWPGVISKYPNTANNDVRFADMLNEIKRRQWEHISFFEQAWLPVLQNPKAVEEFDERWSAALRGVIQHLPQFTILQDLYVDRQGGTNLFSDAREVCKPYEKVLADAQQYMDGVVANKSYA